MRYPSLVVFPTPIASLIVLASALAAPAAPLSEERATLTGQLTCSACWFEADRAKVPYGTDEDVDCAKRCAGDGIGMSLAVRDAAGAYTLYALETGAIAGGHDALLAAVGASIEASGLISRKNDKPVLRVDALHVLAPRSPALASPPPTATGDALALHDLSGVAQRLDALKGRIVVLNFWATWCKPCVEEMPDLAKLQSRYGAWGVQVIGAAADEASGRDAVLSFLKKSQVNFPIWLGATTQQMESFGLPPLLPGTVVLDRDGHPVAKFAGRIAPAKIAAALDGLLDGGTAIAAAAPRADASQVPP